MNRYFVKIIIMCLFSSTSIGMQQDGPPINKGKPVKFYSDNRGAIAFLNTENQVISLTPKKGGVQIVDLQGNISTYTRREMRQRLPQQTVDIPENSSAYAHPKSPQKSTLNKILCWTLPATAAVVGVIGFYEMTMRFFSLDSSGE